MIPGGMSRAEYADWLAQLAAAATAHEAAS